MIDHVVYLTLDPNRSPCEKLERALIDEGMNLMIARSLKQVVFYAKAHRLVAILIEIDGPADALAELIQKLQSGFDASDFYLMGLTRREVTPEEWTRLREAGLATSLCESMPEDLILAPLVTRRTLLELQSLGSDPTVARDLASQTRTLLHDLSQPLAALQGKLQILDLKSGDDDPQKEALRSMTKQINKATDVLRKLQELQHKYK